MAKIVLLEDDVLLADMYKISLDAGGHICSVAHDGKSGLELIKSVMPDLVLLDLMMPEMSGDEVLKVMRESDWGKDMPALIMTNISESEAPDTLKTLKFERYIVKANQSLNEVITIINQVLQEKSAGPTQAVA